MFAARQGNNPSVRAAEAGGSSQVLRPAGQREGGGRVACISMFTSGIHKSQDAETTEVPTEG